MRKTSTELGITTHEYDALIKVRDMLDLHAATATQFVTSEESGDDVCEVEASYTINGYGLFNMGFGMRPRNEEDATLFDEAFKKEYNCGTAGCIGGWTHLVMQGIFDPTVADGKPVILTPNQQYAADYYVRNVRCTNTWTGKYPPLYYLFYPAASGGEWTKITPAHAVKAIDNFLNEGDPMWYDILVEAGIRSKD